MNENTLSNSTVLPYSNSDFHPVVRLLQDTLPFEAITVASFAHKVLLDLNFDPQGALVARNEAGRVIGFVLAIARKRPLEDAPPDTERGWITLFGVAEQARRQGVGTQLLIEAENWLRTQGRREVWISPYAPNYWTPGVDEVACADGLGFLHRRGYATAYRPLSMDVSLAGWQQPTWIRAKGKELAQHVSFYPYGPSTTKHVLDFLWAEFPGDWQRYLREAMLAMMAGKRPDEELQLVFHKDKVIGFAHCEGERFGPFGIAKAWRGKGLGAVLLYTTLEQMRQRGLHNAWFLWTDDTTATRLYRPAGFRETRRYAVLKKQL